MEEQWAPLRETDLYEASSEGRIRNAKTGRILKSYLNKRGQEVVCIQIDGKQQTKSVSRLVGEAFYGDICDDKDIYHRDGDGSKNQLSNLIVGTRSDTIKNTYKNGREQTHRKRSVRCVETGEEWKSIIEASIKTGLNPDSISKCVNNSATKTLDGRHFEAIE